MRRIILTIFVLLFPILMSQSQEATEEPATGWEIVERCVGEPTTPPDDWTFEGTILTRGEDGVYGINADWETRRILAFRPNDTQLAFLSPEGWYWVTFQGSYFCTGSCNSTTRHVNQMTVHDLRASTPMSQRFDWAFYTPDSWKRPIGRRGIPIMYWFSPHEFLYVSDLNIQSLPDRGEPTLFNILTTTREQYETDIYPDEFHYLSPDGLSMVEYYGESEVIDGTTEWSYFIRLIDAETQEIIANLPEGLFPAHNLTLNAWSANSQYFLAYDYIDGNSNVYLIDRFGNSLGVISSHAGNPPFDSIELDWSSDGRYLYIENSTRGDERYMITYGGLIIDLENQQSFDLCINTETRVGWSPDSSQLAFQDTDSDAINILDLSTWSFYEAVDNSDAFLVSWQHE